MLISLISFIPSVPLYTIAYFILFALLLSIFFTNIAAKPLLSLFWSITSKLEFVAGFLKAV